MYSDLDKIRDTLATKNIIMSSSVKIIDYTVKQYCITDDANKIVTYCLTTALVDSEKKSLGNINMGGTEGPVTALAIIDTHQLNAKIDEVDIVFQTLVETLVCTCWDEKQPGGFESVRSWLDITQARYVEADKPTIKSTISGLAGKELILEITHTGNSYLWTLLISQ